MERSSALGLNYQYYPNLDLLIFEDGVCYTTEEAVILAKISNSVSEDLKAVHMVKKMFDGRIMRESEGRDVAGNVSWLESVPPCREQDTTPIIPATSLCTQRFYGRRCTQRLYTVPDAEKLFLDL